MKTKVSLIFVTLLGLASANISYWCIFTSRYCYGTWVDLVHESFTQPLYYFFLYAWPAILLILFVRESVFRSWLRLVPYYAIIAILFVVFNPVSPAPGTFLDPFPFYRSDAAVLAGQIFSAATLAFVVWKYAVARRNKSRAGS